MRKRYSLTKLIRNWGVLFLVGFPLIILAIDAGTSYREVNSQAGKMRVGNMVDPKYSLGASMLKTYLG